MVQVRIEEKPSFMVAGRKTWISGQGSEQFATFWTESRTNGLLDTLRDLSDHQPGSVTNSYAFDVSCVDDNPSNRVFDFFIAAEISDTITKADLDCRTIPPCRWAIFSNRGKLPMSLIDAEMYAFMEWLPQSGCRHANAPELEVYPAHDSSLVEFWLPVTDNP